MNQFLAKYQSFEVDGLVLIEDQEAFHVSKVLRYRIGDPIHVTNGNGDRAQGIIEDISKKKVTIRIQNIEHFATPRTLVLILGLLHNKNRLEFAIEKAVELGVTHIILFAANNSDFKKINVNRVESYVHSALKQSLGVWLPQVEVCKDLKEAISNCPVDAILVFHEKAELSPKYDDYSKQNVAVVIGPEGGLSDSEVEYMSQKEYSILSLGDRRLRSETAVITALSRLTR